MEYRILETSDGKKIQHIKSGDLAGSIGLGADERDIPTAAPKVTKPTVDKEEPIVEVVPVIPELPTYDITSSLYQDLLDNKSVFEAMSKQQRINALTPHEELSYLMIRLSTQGDLDHAQLHDIYRLLYKSVVKNASTDKPPTNEEWATWLAGVEAQINDPLLDHPDEKRAQLLALLDQAKSGEKPSALSYALLTRAYKKVIGARLSLDEGYRYISAWFDASPVAVKWQVAKFRKQYLEAEARGEILQVPDGYARGYKKTSGSAPKDPASIYGHYMAENPELYDPPATPTKFVAFDTETTGFLEDPDTSIIQVGLVEYDSHGNEVRRFVSYIRPPLDENGDLSTGSVSAVATHGILPKHVADAPSFAELVPTLKEYFDGATVIGQNVITFDQKMLSREYVRAADGDKTAGYNVWPRAADTLYYVQRHMYDLDLPNNKLETLNNHFNLGAFDAHDAGADAHVSAKLFFHMRKTLKERQLKASAERKVNDEWRIR